MATIGSAVYSHSIETTRARLRAASTLRPSAHAPAAAPSSSEYAPGQNVAREDDPTVLLPAAELRMRAGRDPDSADGAAVKGDGWFSGLRWGRLALAMLTVFALAFGYLTIAEIGLGRSLAAVVNGQEGSGTTLSRVVAPSPPDSTDSTNEDSKDGESTESADPEPSSDSDPTKDPTSDSQESDEPTESSSPTSDSSSSPSDAPAPTSGGDGANAEPTVNAGPGVNAEPGVNADPGPQ